MDVALLEIRIYERTPFAVPIGEKSSSRVNPEICRMVGIGAEETLSRGC